MKLCVWLMLLGYASSLIISKDIKLSPNKEKDVEYRINTLPFGFQKGANISVVLECEDDLSLDESNKPTLELFKCPKGIHDVKELKTYGVCDSVDGKRLTPQKIEWNDVIQKPEFLQLCLKEKYEKRDTDSCTLNAIFLNPSAQHLSSDQMLIPRNYIIIMAIWTLSSVLWILNFVCYCKYSNNLHKLLSLIIVIKLINICLSFIYWVELNKKGRVALQIDLCYMLCSSVFSTSIFILLMLAGEGWCILWERPRLLKYYMILAGAFLLMDVCYKYVHKYFQGFAIVFASMMIYIAFKCSTISILTVKKNITASDQFIDNHKLTYKSSKTLKQRLTKKMRLLISLQGLIIGLPCILIIVESVASFLLVYSEWVRWLLLELLFYLVLLYCCMLFRLQDFEEYNNITINTQYNDVRVVLTPSKNVMYISQGLEEEDEGKETEVTS